MRPILLEFGPWKLYGYGAMIVLGGVLSFYFLYKRKSDAGLKNEDDFWLLVNTILIGGFLGGRLLYLVEYTRWFSPEFWRTLWSPGSGFSVLGSFVGVPASVWIFCRIRQVPFMRLMDVICVMAPLWHVFGRFGCLLAGCCHGRPTFANWGIVFRNPRSMVRPEWLGVPLYPTQILEAIGSALMAFYLYRLFQKSAGKPAGLVTAVYFASYGLLRCVMEYYRGDTVAFTSVMTIGQLLGLSLIGISGIVLFWRQRCSQPC